MALTRSQEVWKQMRYFVAIDHRRHKLLARLKILIGLVLVIAFVTPLRNLLVPGFPRILEDINTFKLIRMYLGDLVFYVDRSPYDGSCEMVHRRLAKVRMPTLDEMPVYEMSDWVRERKRLSTVLGPEELDTMDKFKPSMNNLEQKQIMYAMLSATQAFTAFNISYFIRGGSLLGYWRHHGRMPWDEDVDILVDSGKWPLAKQVLSCLPDLQLNMGADYMWKLFHKDAQLWRDETFIKFPYIDIFLYKADSGHVWPLTIWMKLVTMPAEWTLPTIKGVFEGWPVNIPREPIKILERLYGRVSTDCYSQIFLRRQRHLIPRKEWTHIPCSLLQGIYPHVVRRIEKGVVVEDRMLGSKFLSTFNATYHGTLG
ncbi:uncharacterized protein LOC101855430 [Aplysia californica]|uniref:Uncharacterized protein LOC101855430 n=1 Tax=Aplysia californica TaxID=6500 RepID=A0ABM1A484_APLCA|nr:uncharacterized protein LOC101855430 [Aplysia californica]